MKYLINIIISMFWFNTSLALSSSSEFDGIVIGFNSDWKPYSFLTSTKLVEGILVEEIKRKFEKLGIKPSFIALPWARLQHDVAKGTIDAFVTVPTNERLMYADTSKKIFFTVNMRAFVNKNNPRIEELKNIKNIEEFKKFKVCDLLGNGWAEKVFKENNINAEFFRTTFICLRHIYGGRSDIAIIAEDVGQDIINEEKFDDKMIKLPAVYNKMEFTFLVSKKSKYLKILNVIDN